MIVRRGVELPDSSEVIKYSDISADSGDEVGLDHGDVTGVGEVEEWLEAHHKVG